MGNKLACGEIKKDGVRGLKNAYNLELHKSNICVEDNTRCDNKYDEENYFYRYENEMDVEEEDKREYSEDEIKEEDKNVVDNNNYDDIYNYHNDINNKNKVSKKIENDNMYKKYIINVKRILMYIKEYEEDFLCFFKKNNVTSMIYLKYIVLNYKTYIMIIEKGVIYIGEVNENNEKNGLGIIITPDQCIYIGEFEEDKITGFGLYIHSSRSKYIGYWKRGKANRYGIFIHPDSTFYKGYWLNDKQNKNGIEYVYNNYVYIGNYFKGEKNKFGIFVWNNECMYIGQIKDNYFFNRGIYFFNKYKIYIGKWKSNCVYGKCEIIWNDNRQFFGYHINNLKQGLGIYKWDDGRIYFGNWLNNKQHGSGIFIIIKNFKEYQQYIQYPIFLLFKNTEKIKKNFLLNLSKENIFYKGNIGKYFHNLLNKYDNYNFYNFLFNLLYINFYELCSSFFDYIKKKNINDFKTNHNFYNTIKDHICLVTDHYFNNQICNQKMAQAQSTFSFLADIKKKNPERNTNIKNINIINNNNNNINNNNNNNNTNNNINNVDAYQTSHSPNNIKMKNNKENAMLLHRFNDQKNNKFRNNMKGSDNEEIIVDKKKYENNNNYLKSYINYEGPKHNQMSSLTHEQINRTSDLLAFQDIQRLILYINSINLNDMSEKDINKNNPLFSYASKNILLKYGKWKKGRLKKWLYASDDSLGVVNMDPINNDKNVLIYNGQNKSLPSFWRNKDGRMKLSFFNIKAEDNSNNNMNSNHNDNFNSNSNSNNSSSISSNNSSSISSNNSSSISSNHNSYSSSSLSSSSTNSIYKTKKKKKKIIKKKKKINQQIYNPAHQVEKDIKAKELIPPSSNNKYIYEHNEKKDISYDNDHYCYHSDEDENIYLHDEEKKNIHVPYNTNKIKNENIEKYIKPQVINHKFSNDYNFKQHHLSFIHNIKEYNDIQLNEKKNTKKIKKNGEQKKKLKNKLNNYKYSYNTTSMSDCISNKSNHSISFLNASVNSDIQSLEDKRKDNTYNNTGKYLNNKHIVTDISYKDIQRKNKEQTEIRYVNNIMKENKKEQNDDEEINRVENINSKENINILKQHINTKQNIKQNIKQNNKNEEMNMYALSGDSNMTYVNLDDIKKKNKQNMIIKKKGIIRQNKMNKKETISNESVINKKMETDKRNSENSKNSKNSENSKNLRNTKNTKNKKNSTLPYKYKNYDLPKKGFSLIWSLKKSRRNSPLSTKEKIMYQNDDQSCDNHYDKKYVQNDQLTDTQQKKKSFFRNFLSVNKNKKKNTN
ncbi:putative phosphatidylinositol-4-phosphate 5-kinase [Plasmodium gaboni]|uniref:Putative phosphatidylinositol-4-phosphate 5-kinase n=1 Tax=Plasmodium gaboni TaxID=647221 RepID=A0A151LJ31_9APIC|nr:putative phosphatidylinositol-4-phosphate 5-kinase [Plasmodium gaboni]KYN98934.1 putative phosphatidylinositol-4-phosphate 5-kinase [Plasmodium gaboni]